MRRLSKHAGLASLIALAACVPAPEAPPPPRPTHRPVPPPPPPQPAPQATDWRDIPLTPGDWRYVPGSGGSEAQFVMAGVGPAFILRCDAASRRISLIRPVGGGTQLRVTTSFGKRSLPGTADGAGVAAALPATDPFLDSLAFSRGRFTVESESGAMLVIPAWPEPARVIEDCRG